MLIDQDEGAKGAKSASYGILFQDGVIGKVIQSERLEPLPAVLALMQQYEQASSGKQDDEDEPETLPRVIYASRTHSQLSQFVAELKKTSFGQINTVDAAEQLPIRTIGLGSRKQMCITRKSSVSEESRIRSNERTMPRADESEEG